MKFETLTYSAHVIDYSVRASAPEIMGRSTPPKGELSAAPLSDAFLQLWMWMSLQVMGCLAKCGLQEPVSKPSHILILPSANPDAPQISVRVNRSILRKLRRLERIKPDAFLEKAEPQPEWVKDLSPMQYLEYLIRVHKWNRVHTYRLGETWHDAMRRVIEALSLQGDAVSLRLAASCNALISPD